MRKQSYNVKYRLDGVLVEMKGVKAGSLREATAQALDGFLPCLTEFVCEHRGMTLELLNGYPYVVGVETSDAWDD